MARALDSVARWLNAPTLPRKNVFLRIKKKQASWKPGKRVKDEDACLHAAEEMFSLHAPIGNARYFMIRDVSGDSCRKTVKRGLRRRHRRRDVRER